jgi:hypothetical protein
MRTVSMNEWLIYVWCVYTERLRMLRLGVFL